MFTTTVITLVILPLIAKFAFLIDKIDLLARMMMAALFILAGFGKLGAPEKTVDYMTAHGLSAFLFFPTIGFEIIFGLLLLIGFKTRFVAFILAAFTIISAVIFHLDFGDQTQMTQFLKNLTIAGGFLMVAKHGSAHFSIDQYIRSRKMKTSTNSQKP